MGRQGHFCPCLLILMYDVCLLKLQSIQPPFLYPSRDGPAFPPILTRFRSSYSNLQQGYFLAFSILPIKQSCLSIFKSLLVTFSFFSGKTLMRCERLRSTKSPVFFCRSVFSIIGTWDISGEIFLDYNLISNYN